MSQDTKLQQLVINKLTTEQYNEAVEAGTIDENQLYMTTDAPNVTDVKVGNTSVVNNNVATLGTMAGETAANYSTTSVANTLYATKSLETTATNHITNTSNPHSVTKSQVGLGNVDNTADLDKPISTATQTALNNKVDKVSTASRVYGTDGSGIQTTYDKDSFTLINDITVDDISIVSNKVADLGSMALESSSNYYTKSNVYNKTEIDGLIGSVYKPAGNVEFANLPQLSASVLGNVYNVIDAFTTTSYFVEGAGKSYPAGTNVVIVDTGSSTYKYDVLSGFVDLSSYALDANVVHKAGDEEVTGIKTFTGEKRIKFKQAISSNKLGFTLYNTSNTELGFLEYNPNGTKKVLTLGYYGTNDNNQVYVGFRRSGGSKNYNLLTPLGVNVHSGIGLSSTVSDLYFLLGLTDGTTTSITGDNGVINLKTINGSSILGSGDLTISGLPSQTGQSGKFLTTDGTDASWAAISVTSDNKSITNNSSNEMQTVGVINSRDKSTAIKTWTGTKEQYDELLSLGWATPTYVENLGADSWNNLIYDGTKFIALGENAYITTSADGLTWTEATYIENLDTNSDYYWVSMIYDGTKYLVLSNDGHISTSTDGTTWTVPVQDSNLGSRTWNDLTYGNNKFVALDSDGYISTSTDGTTWTTPSQEIDGGYYWYNLTYGDNKFVALSNYGDVSTSTDGETWTTPVNHTNIDADNIGFSWSSLIYDGSKYVALGNYGYISISEDAISWSDAILIGNLNNYYWYGLANDGTKCVAITNGSYISTCNNNAEIVNENTIYNTNSDGIYLGTNKIADLANNATLTIYQGGVSKGTFSANASSNSTIYLNDKDAIDEKSIIKSSNKLQTVGVIDSRDNTTAIKTWTGTETQYNNVLESITWSGTTDISWKDWGGIAYNGIKFVAIGKSGYISTSTDGTTWTSATRVSNLGRRTWNDLTYGNNKFVALDSDGYISTSTDGTTWTSATLVSNLGSRSWHSITYDGSKFVAISSSGYISTSTNGTTWTTATLVSNLGNRTWNGLIYGNSKFVAISSTGYISTSTNGTTWTSATLVSNLGSRTWVSLAYDGTKYAALSTTGYNSISTDGINWSTATLDNNLGNNYWRDLIFDGTKFVAIGEKGYVRCGYYGDPTTLYNVIDNGLFLGKNKIAGGGLPSQTGQSGKFLTTDGTDASWAAISVTSDNKSITNNSSNEMQTVGIIDSRDNTTAIKTWTGTKEQYDALFSINWSSATNNLGSYNWSSLVYNGSIYVAMSYDGYISTSTNGTTWTSAEWSHDLSDNGWSSIVYDGTRFITMAGGSIGTSDDGTTWYYTDWSSELGNHYCNDFIYDGTKFIAISLDGYITTSTNGTTWTTPTYIDNLGNHNWYRIRYNGTKYVAISSAGYISSSMDGETWTVATQVSNLGNNDWYGLVYDGTRFVAISSSGYVSSSEDGLVWSLATQDSNLGNNDWRDIIYDGTKFVAISNTGYNSSGNVNIDSNTIFNIKNTGLYLGTTKISDISNNSSLKINQGNVLKGTFTANSLTDVTINLDGKDNKSITNNSSNEMQTVGIIDSRDNTTVIKTWTGTKAQYDELASVTWSSAISKLGSRSWYGITYGNGKFVSLGYNGYISTSTDGTTWTTATLVSKLGSRSWLGITYGNGKFVALSYSGYVSTSTDGTTWTTATLVSKLASRYWYGITYGNNKFVALSTTGYISTSTDGTTWSEAEYYYQLGNKDWRDIIYDGTKFVALGNDGYVSTSTDGITWSQAIQDSNLGNNSWNSLTYTDGLFVALSYYGYISTSADGTTWLQAIQDSNLGNNSWFGITYGNGKFVSLGYNGYISNANNNMLNYTLYNVVDNGLYLNYFKISDITHIFNLRNDTEINFWTGNKEQYNYIVLSYWTQPVQNSTLNSKFLRITYGDSKYVGLSSDGYVSTSTDGTTWSEPTQVSNLGSNYWINLVYDGSKYVAIGERGYVSTSTDGTTWSEAEYYYQLGNSSWRKIVYGDYKFVALGYTGYISTSTNGTTWTQSIQDSNLGNNEWCGLAYGNGKFVALGNDGYVSTSTDGITWSVATQNSNLGSNDWRDVIYDGNEFVALNYNGDIQTSTDGITWSERIFRLDENNWQFLVYNNKKIMAVKSSGYISFSGNLNSDVLYNVVDDGLYLGNDKIASLSKNTDAIEIATTTKTGVVKPDGTSISITNDGTISSLGITHALVIVDYTEE